VLGLTSCGSTWVSHDAWVSRPFVVHSAVRPVVLSVWQVQACIACVLKLLCFRGALLL
jgi:hypothetical protein